MRQKVVNTNLIIQGDALIELKKLPSESVNCCMTSPPYWALRDYGNSVETIWDGLEGCEHEWKIEETYRPNSSGGHGELSKIQTGNKGSFQTENWDRPSRDAFKNRDVNLVCSVCNKQFEGKPNQKFCSKECLNTLSNEERQNRTQISNLCSKCGAWKGQLGLEPTFDLYIKHLCDIFDEVKRVLRKDGTCWVNIGDSYSGSGKAGNNSKYQEKHTSFGKIMEKGSYGIPTKSELEDKSLCNIPARFSIEMQNRGWILRNVIIWYKPNCMPCSVKDRFTVDFEYLFFFVKSKKYWFETIYEPHLTQEKRQDGIIRNRTMNYSSKFNENPEAYNSPRARTKREGYNAEKHFYSPQGRNKRAVWTITTKPFKEAHFATYPEALCETPLKAGCPEGGIVLDPFFGAGTTGLVALKQNKKFIGIELNKKYIEIAEKRLKPFLCQTKL